MSVVEGSYLDVFGRSDPLVDIVDAEEVYDQIQKIKWDDILDVKKTFSVDSVVYSEEFRNSRFVTYKVKDAIVDWFREKQGTRPGG